MAGFSTYMNQTCMNISFLFFIHLEPCTSAGCGSGEPVAALASQSRPWGAGRKNLETLYQNRRLLYFKKIIFRLVTSFLEKGF